MHHHSLHTHPLFTQLLKGVTISQGGVLPHIPEVLLFRKSQLTKATKPRPKTTPITAPPPKPGTTTNYCRA